ncbi:hypothetical protein CK934_29195 [Chitinophaga sp. MD30]|nr:hypothetical protein CK934_29195 [Chitinophaga sp. MD30]
MPPLGGLGLEAVYPAFDGGVGAAGGDAQWSEEPYFAFVGAMQEEYPEGVTAFGGDGDVAIGGLKKLLLEGGGIQGEQVFALEGEFEWECVGIWQLGTMVVAIGM